MSSELAQLWEGAGGQVPPNADVVPFESLLAGPKAIAVGVMYPGEHCDDGVPLIKVGDINGGRIPAEPKFKVSQAVNTEYQRTQLRGDELLITLVGEPGACVVATSAMKGWNPARAIAVIRLKDPSLRTYVKAVLESRPGKHLIDSVLNTTVQKTLNLKDIRQLPVPLPARSVVDAVSQVVDALDDRITLLRETNATLEAIAQALFKSWFVDFDPVRAKMAGRVPEGVDEANAALFPDALEETELGVVPKGWRFGTVGDFARLKKGTVNPGSQPDAVFEHFSLPAFDNGCRPVVEHGEAIKSNKTPVPSDAVLLSKLNPHIPRVWLPVTCGSNAVCSTEFLVFQPVGVGSKELIYCTFSSPDFILRLQQLVTGTSNSHQRIKPDQVELMSCAVPSKDIASQFGFSMKPIFERVHANREQAQTLASLRDTLLPRLISGQLRLPEAQAMLEEAT